MKEECIYCGRKFTKDSMVYDSALEEYSCHGCEKHIAETYPWM